MVFDVHGRLGVVPAYLYDFTSKPTRGNLSAILHQFKAVLVDVSTGSRVPMPYQLLSFYYRKETDSEWSYAGQGTTDSTGTAISPPVSIDSVPEYYVMAIYGGSASQGIGAAGATAGPSSLSTTGWIPPLMSSTTDTATIVINGTLKTAGGTAITGVTETLTDSLGTAIPAATVTGGAFTATYTIPAPSPAYTATASFSGNTSYGPSTATSSPENIVANTVTTITVTQTVTTSSTTAA